MASDLLHRKATHFVLWRPRLTNPSPTLVIGKLKPGNPPDFVEAQRFDLRPSPLSADLWERPAAECGLAAGSIYHYWFEVNDSNPYKEHGERPARILCTDPTAWTTDWRLLAPPPAGPYGAADRDPASVVQFQNGQLLPVDPGGERGNFANDAAIATLPPNNRLVIYELPSTWTQLEELEAPVQLAVGTFRDVKALIDDEAEAANFSGLPVLEKGRAHLKHLGVNALELLPPADSFVDREWGYATSNYFAADYDLGFPKRHLSPTATQDLADLIRTCHAHGMRFFTDVVMAFATQYAYQNINFLDFHVNVNTNDPERFLDDGRERSAFGGDLFKYNFWTEAYDPISGTVHTLVPARQLMKLQLVRWMLDFRVDGIRLDSIENIKNYDFVQEYKDLARSVWKTRATAQGLSESQADARFLVVGEELAVPFALLAQQRLDGLWNEKFKQRVRSAILGQGVENESFEWTVRQLIDCRLLSDQNGAFTDGAQAINYVTSHDVEGFRNERLYDFLNNNQIVATEQRIKLAFVCLLTAVGIPMIFAGEEFADEHDLPIRHPQKQADPVNFSRLEGSENAFRRRIFAHVSRLVKFRISSDALAVNNTRFIHVDFNDGKRVMVWQRGGEENQALVVVVANFSDYGTPNPSHPSAEYIVPNFPATPAGKRWREITQERDVPQEWIGREPIFPWEAKVYALVD
ncbi:MAG TPA: alpha-amylase family glycosyl hydrolase [Candidatus Tectomicrobia bacterium]|jgi:1,4-alpha-glucan branching enzyme